MGMVVVVVMSAMVSLEVEEVVVVVEMRKLLKGCPKQMAEKKRPIKFKDVLGGIFNFPFELAQKWEAMSDMINQAFAHVEPIESMVEREYDLIEPSGEIIMPQSWETIVEPEWAVTMHPSWPRPLRPIDERERPLPRQPVGISRPGRRGAKAPSSGK